MVLAAHKKTQIEPSPNAVPFKAERRSRPRAALEWAVHLLRASDEHPIAAKTRNVSSDGFYCLLQHPLESGEQVECTVVIPIPKSGSPDDVLWLKCQTRVLRVESAPTERNFGVAFRIEEYRVVRANPAQHN